MITNCTKCGKVTVIARKDYSSKKKILCKYCGSNGLMNRIVTSIKSVFRPKPSPRGFSPA